MILGIETSCDETAAAVVSPEGVILSNVVSSQAALHAPYGGVVPEVASRRHLELVVPAVERALDDAGMTLDDISTVAVTEGPGLIGALLVGLSAAKALAFARRLPLVPVNHLHGHVAALYLEPDPVEPPFLALLASGGHTLLASVAARGDMTVIGSSLDDAAGEAFDKGARLLGLGYPGGAALEQLGVGRRPGGARASRRRWSGRPGHDFSFSGLKTALARAVRDGGGAPADLAASYQAAIVRALVERAAEAVEATGAGTLAVVGGVARNSVLREAAARRCRELGVRLALAPPELCSDNAAMIASAARFITPLAVPGLPVPRRLRDGRMSVEVRMMTAAGCHLCDEAHDLLEAARAELGFDLVEVDITGDPDLEAEYREQIPVVYVAGRKAFKYRVDPAELRRRVVAATSAA